MSTNSCISDRRKFLSGLAATGVFLPTFKASGQSAPLEYSQRNQSSFRALRWQDFYPSIGKGVLVADITSRAVHYWSTDERVNHVLPCSVPMTEDLTRRGKTEIVRKAENPTWTPTPSMRERDPGLPLRVEGGALGNPLGGFAIYMAWPAYLVHGTHDTRKIGRRSSDGCYGLYNEDVEQLYDVVEIGTQVTVF